MFPVSESCVGVVIHVGGAWCVWRGVVNTLTFFMWSVGGVCWCYVLVLAFEGQVSH